MYVKSELKCIGPNTHLPCTKRCKIRGTAEMDVIYELSQTQHMCGLWGTTFSLSKIAPKIISNLVFSLLYSAMVTKGPRLIEYQGGPVDCGVRLKITDTQ